MCRSLVKRYRLVQTSKKLLIISATSPWNNTSALCSQLAARQCGFVQFTLHNFSVSHHLILKSTAVLFRLTFVMRCVTEVSWYNYETVHVHGTNDGVVQGVFNFVQNNKNEKLSEISVCPDWLCYTTTGGKTSVPVVWQQTHWGCCARHLEGPRSFKDHDILWSSIALSVPTRTCSLLHEVDTSETHC